MHELRSGVVIGTYGLPQLARLQVQIIRATCGQVPILIADDASDHEAAFREIESVTPGVTFAGSPIRLGHYAGDLSAFHKGLRWAEQQSLQYLCKLSQRFIHTAWNWLHDRAAELHASDHSVMMQDCWDNKIRLFVRSECMLFRVDKWAPLLPEFNREVLTNPTEYRIWHLVHAYFGERYLPWPGMPTNRYQHMSKTLWHCVNLPQDYHNTAARFGVTLDAGFTTAGWQSLPGWKKG